MFRGSRVAMSALPCAGCAHANDFGARFCAQCGASLASRCSSCGAELPGGARFCSSCGAAVAADPVAVADGALKVVSVVFSDLVGSTALQEALDTESVRRVMTRYYQAMRAVVDRHQGALQKFIGDAVVVVFGVPIVREDDALRAVRCAVDMVAALDELNAELEPAFGVRLHVRTGVNTGELVVNDDGIFVGDTMNTAARFEQAAGAGQVLIGEATRRLVRHQTQLEQVEPLALKGKSAPVPAWRVLSVAWGPAQRLEAPLVGRTRELARLRSVLEDAVASRRCRLVTVVGSPGVGKSRLAQEFTAAVGGQATTLVGHCQPSGEGITFVPVAEVLRAAAGIAESDAPDAVVDKLTDLLTVEADRDRIVARAAALLGAGDPASPEETFWSVRRLFEALAERRPLVVVLDDVHWGQPLFLDLIEHLVEWVRDAPLLLVALARPELREVRDALTSAGRRASEVIELDSLGSGESRELVEGLLGRTALPAALLERILETTGGNPLFLGELLRMLVDEGALVRTGDGWVAASGADAVLVPPTIQALLTARIERLTPHQRSVVERASVIGTQFYRGAVAELVAPPVRPGLDGHLETLRRKDMVEPDGTYWIDEPVYRFHHVLIRDAAYHLLLKEARAELHERFADWLATKAGELVGEHEEVIAYHLERAFAYRRQLGPLDERGRAIGVRAARLLWSAGQRALSREDLAAAANLLQRAHECGADHAVLWDLGEALLCAGDTAAAAAVVNKLSGPRRVVLETQLAVLTGSGPDLPRVVAATQALAATDDLVGAAKGHHVTAQVQAQLGQVADAEASLDKALLAARKAGDRRRITAVLAAAPRVALWGPSPVVRASGRCLDVVRILRMTPGNRHVEAIALRCQATLEAMRGRADAAREILAAGRTTLEELGLTLELHELAVHAGIVELLDGRPEAAESLLRPARDGFAALGVVVSAGQAAALLARALIDQGRDEEAAAETEFAERRAGGDLKTTVTWCGVRAEALARRGAIEEAVALAQRAAALAEPTDALADKADAHMALARVLMAAGRADEARGVAAAARRLYAEKDHVAGAKRAERLAGYQPGDREAMSARDDELTRAVPDLGDGPTEGYCAEFVRRHGAHDVEAVLDLVTDHFVLNDHRGSGRDPICGREQFRTLLESTPALMADVPGQIEEMIACDEDVAAFRVRYRGHSRDSGDEVSSAVGYVAKLSGGVAVSVDLYEPDDRQAMIARYAELGGGLSKLGTSPVERVFVEFCKRLAGRDVEPLLELVTADFQWTDRRNLAWEPVCGREGIATLVRSGWEGNTDIRIEVDEVLACDGRVLAVRFRWVGHGSRAGAFEIPVGQVVVNDGARNRSVDQYNGADREAMLARYAELGGTHAVLTDRPSERFLAEALRLLDRREFERMRELLAESWRSIDHRALGWEDLHGPEAWEASTRSFYEASPTARVEVLEVLACDDQVIAVRQAWRAHGAKAGEMEVVAGAVYLIEAGRWISVDYYEPDDHRAMIARYAELGGGAAPLGDRAPELFFKKWLPPSAAGDMERLAALLAEDFVGIDHRALGWEPLRGREANVELWRSAHESADHIRQEVEEVLACDDRVIAWRFRWCGEAASTSGGGEFSASVGQVNVIEDGLWRSCDQYDPGDREGMLARFAELGGHVAAVRVGREAERLLDRVLSVINERDYVGLERLVAQDWVWADHRPLGWEQAAGPDQAQALIRGLMDGSPHGRVEFDEVIACDDRLIAVVMAWRGRGIKAGEYEMTAGAVWEFRDGRWAGVDFYDPDDRQGMIARYAERGGGAGRLGNRPPEEVSKRYLRAFAARDIEALTDLTTDDIAWVDHRGLSWEQSPGKGAWLTATLSAFRGVSDIRVEIDEVLACDDRVIAVVFSWRGTASPGAGRGPFELSVGHVTVIDGSRIARVEQFEPHDREGMLARFGELSGTPSELGARAAAYNHDEGAPV